MNNLVSRLMDAAKKFSLWDYVFFKITLISAGILIGIYFSKYIMTFAPLLWVILIIAYTGLMRGLLKHIH